MKRKRNILFASTQEYNPDIIVLTEHGIKPTDIELFIIPNYRLTSYYCRTQKRSGGVAIYVKLSLDIDVVNLASIENLSVEMTCELAAIKFNIGKITFRVVGVYRSPSSNNYELFNEKLQDITSGPEQNVNTYIIGDFNLNFLEKSKTVTELLSIFEIPQYKLIFNEITRPSRNGGTCIDNIITNSSLKVIEKEIIAVTYSDHFAQRIKIQIPTEIKQIVYRKNVRCINDSTLHELNYLLSMEEWKEMYECTDPDLAYKAFLSAFLHHFNVACPYKIKKIKPSKQKFECNEKVQHYSALLMILKHAHHSDEEMLRDEIVKCKNKLRIAHNEAVKNYHSNRIRNSNNVTKETWNIINNLKTTRVSRVNEIKLEVQGIP